MITYDEEIGSHSSRALIERSAQAARGPDGAAVNPAAFQARGAALRLCDSDETLAAVWTLR